MKKILAGLLTALMLLCLGPVAAVAADTPVVTVTISYADISGYYVTPQTQFTIPANLSEQHGFDDDFDGEKISVLDAIVYLHLLLDGDVDGLDTLETAFGVMVTNFMGDGMGAFMFFVNGEDPGLGAAAVEINDGDTVSFFSINDTFFWSDYYTWFEADGEKIDAVTIAIGETLELTLEGSMFGMSFGPVEDADILLLDIEDLGEFNAAAFDDAAILAATDEDGIAEIAFAQAGTYYVSATLPEPGDYYDAIMAPWLVVTVTDPAAAALAEAKATAKAALDSYKNADDYRAAQKTELANAIAAGKAAIDAATTIADINTARDNAKAAMDDIMTNAQLKAQETLLAKWQARLPDWMKWTENLWKGFQYVILFGLFGWIWFLF